jgi:hypothetical protein
MRTSFDRWAHTPQSGHPQGDGTKKARYTAEWPELGCVSAADSRGRAIFVVDARRSEVGKRARAGGNDTLVTMKTFFSIILAVAVSISTVRAGPARRAANVARNTAETAKNVGHSVAKGTKRAVHTVVDTLTRPTR